jgi:hypothetical protein
VIAAPSQTELFEALADNVGSAFTATFTVEVLVQPLASVPVTV